MKQMDRHMDRHMIIHRDHTYIHTYIHIDHTYIHTCMHAYIQIMHTYILIIHTYIHTHHTYIHIIHTYIHTHTHTYTHINHTHTHTHQSYIHTHTYIHVQVLIYVNIYGCIDVHNTTTPKPRLSLWYMRTNTIHVCIHVRVSICMDRGFIGFAALCSRESACTHMYDTTCMQALPDVPAPWTYLEHDSYLALVHFPDFQTWQRKSSCSFLRRSLRTVDAASARGVTVCGIVCGVRTYTHEHTHLGWLGKRASCYNYDLRVEHVHTHTCIHIPLMGFERWVLLALLRVCRAWVVEVVQSTHTNTRFWHVVKQDLSYKYTCNNLKVALIIALFFTYISCVIYVYIYAHTCINIHTSGAHHATSVQHINSYLLLVGVPTSANAQESVPKLRAAPQIRPVPKIRAAPQIRPVPKIRSVPQIRPVPKMRSVPQIRPVPKMRSVPQIRPVPKIRSVPQIRPVPKIRSVPQIRPVPKMLPFDHAQHLTIWPCSTFDHLTMLNIWPFDQCSTFDHLTISPCSTFDHLTSAQHLTSTSLEQ